MENFIELDINTSKNYKIKIGRGLLNNISLFLKKYRDNCNIVLITDDIVNSLYVDKVVENLSKNGFNPHRFIIENGEKSKNLNTVTDILNFLADNNINRNDIILAIGGGVVGDISGFVASIYLRGIDYIQVPTTFLSSIDSSVGGKTGVNLDKGKNLVGSFNHPLEVICDVDTFKTLDKEIFSEGVAEAIKYGILFDKALFNRLATSELHQNSHDLEEIISTCVNLKAKIVQSDEFDKGNRQLLNLGHTIAHSIEKNSNFTIHHGIAVAIGTAIITKASEVKSIGQKGIYNKVKNCLLENNLPIEIEYTTEDIYKYIKYDKKVSGDFINLIVPIDIGYCKLYKLNLNEVYDFIKVGR